MNLRSWLPGLVVGAALLGTGEIAARRWIEANGDALEKSRFVLRPDAHVGWRQRLGLDTEFLKLPLHTDEHGWRVHAAGGAATGKRILFLGPSSTFGWGVGDHDTYAAHLERLLSSAGVRTLNAGEIGFSTFQGQRILEEGLALKPDLVVLAYGVNDVDRHRFYFQSDRPDSQEFAEPKASGLVAWTTFMNSYGIPIVEMRLAASIRERLLLSRSRTSIPANPIPGLRVSRSEFEGNFARMIRRLREKGLPILILSTTTEYRHATPSTPREMREAAAALVSEALGHYSQHRLSEARSALERALALDPNQSDGAYLMSSLHAAEGNAKGAKEWLERARTNEPWRIERDVEIYNEALFALGRREGVPMVNLEAVLGSKDRASLFVDPIHFSTEGNRRIADALLPLVRKALAL